jgi:hypothetical protein
VLRDAIYDLDLVHSVRCVKARTAVDMLRSERRHVVCSIERRPIASNGQCVVPFPPERENVMSNELPPNQFPEQPRSLAMSAGHITLAVSAELGRLLAAHGGDRRKALAAGFAELTTRKTIQPKEATELAAIMEMFFDAPHGQDSKLAKRASTYFHALVLDAGSSPAALAVASVITSLTSPTKAPDAGSTQKAAAAVSKGDVVFGGFGAVVGAGIGFGFGGPIGAGIGAAVGAAVGVCIEKS